MLNRRTLIKVVTGLFTPIVYSADTERWLHFIVRQTGEEVSVIYKRNGELDADGYSKICHTLRDVDTNTVGVIDVRLLDILDGIRAALVRVGVSDPIFEVYLAYVDNLNKNSEGLKTNYHAQGRAIDFSVLGVPSEKLHKWLQEVSFHQGIGLGLQLNNDPVYLHLDTRITNKIVAWTFKSQTDTGKGNNTNVATGSGFYINEHGYLLTNYHVISSAKNIVIKFNDLVLSASVIALDEVNDIAVLKTEKLDNVLPVKFSKESGQLGESVYVIGYPLSSILSNDMQMTSGNISALSGVKNDYRFYQMSAPVQSGNSGGPLIDSKGKLVGIVTSKLNVLSVVKKTGDMPQNVNFAIKSDVVKILLASKSIKYYSSDSAEDIKGQQIANMARSYVVYIEAYE